MNNQEEAQMDVDKQEIIDILSKNNNEPNHQTYFAVLKNIGIEYRFNQDDMQFQFKENDDEFLSVDDIDIIRIINLSNDKFPTIKNWKESDFREGIRRVCAENIV